MFSHLINNYHACKDETRNHIIPPQQRLEAHMTNRGRPSKILTQNDLDELEIFLRKLPFLKKNQQQALILFTQSSAPYSEPQLKLLKTVHREKNQFQTRQALIQHIQLKQKNQQTLIANEVEILGLLNLTMDQDQFFRLDRALESYQKIEKALLQDRIRVEKEDRKELLRKTNKELTEAQKKRNAENKLKYELGGAVLAAWKELIRPIENIEAEKVKNMIVNNQCFYSVMSQTTLYQYIHPRTGNYFQTRKLFVQVIEGLCEYTEHDLELYVTEVNNLLKQP